MPSDSELAHWPQPLINADFARALAMDIAQIDWSPSPQPGVHRKALDRVGGELARATSIVRYAAGARFSAHVHALGEEFLVLEGSFADEHGHYPAGTYVRNPPGSAHAPWSPGGCVLFVKLRQMPATERLRRVVDTRELAWQHGTSAGHRIALLYRAADTTEQVTLESLADGSALPATDLPGGEELLLLSGALIDNITTHRSLAWLRTPPGRPATLRAKGATTMWRKYGHLGPAV